MSTPRERFTRLAGAAMVALAVSASGCSRPPTPTPSPSARPAASSPAARTESEAAAVKRVVAAWRHTVEWVKIPPLTSLDWRLLKAGAKLPSDTLVITDAQSRAILRIPATCFKPSFVALVGGGRVLGYQMADDQVELEIQPETLFPLRLPPDTVQPGATIEAVVARVDGVVVYSPDRDLIARSYAALTAHNPPYGPHSEEAVVPTLAPQPVHVRKGLGVRGKDLAALGADARRNLFLDSQDGVYVDAVIPGSPADRVGMQAHDVIRRLGTAQIRDSRDLMRALEAVPADTPIEVEVVRTIIDKSATQKFVYKVTLGEFTGNANVVPSPNPTSLPADAASSSPASSQPTSP